MANKTVMELMDNLSYSMEASEASVDIRDKKRKQQTIQFTQTSKKTTNNTSADQAKKDNESDTQCAGAKNTALINNEGKDDEATGSDMDMESGSGKATKMSKLEEAVA